MNESVVLHINNSYGGTTVYYNLYSNLDKLGIIQHIFVPLNPKNHSRLGNQQIDFITKCSTLNYSCDLKKFHKYFYSLKIKTIISSIEKSDINLSKIKIIHSSSLCLDGAVAYLLWKKYKTPYIVTIRNTDINTYYRNLFWKRPFFLRILKHASKIIFISPVYKESFLHNVIHKKISSIIQERSIAIPNGVENIFLHNRSYKSIISSPIKIIYTGGVQKNKNIHSVIKALENIRSNGWSIDFTIIGKGLKHRHYNSHYLEMIEKYTKSFSWISILPSQDRNTLLKSYSNQDIFVMPSFHETFGLSYVEALTQGLPIIYTKGQGIDGFFEDGLVGFPVYAKNIKDIEEKLILVIQNYEKITENIRRLNLKEFDWGNIAAKYQSIYSEFEYKTTML